MSVLPIPQQQEQNPSINIQDKSDGNKFNFQFNNPKI